MKSIWGRICTIACIVVILSVACQPSQPAPPLPKVSQPENLTLEDNQLPVYIIRQRGPSPEAVQRLAEALEQPEIVLDETQSIHYMDPQRFIHIPTYQIGPGQPDEDEREVMLEAIDFEALRRITVLDDGQALELAANAWRRAGLDDFLGTPGLQAEAYIEHARVDGNWPDGSEMDLPLDTEVLYAFTLNGLPLLGPGAKARMGFDSEGRVTQLTYAMWGLEPAERVTITPPEQANQLCAQSLDLQIGASGATVFTNLIYYAPSQQNTSVTKIYPHYLCGAKMAYTDWQGNPGEFKTPLQYLPAMQDGLKVGMRMSVEGDEVRGKAQVSGGTPPYSFSWSSSSTPLSIEQVMAGESVRYRISPREPIDHEILGLSVVDADGLSAWTRQQVSVNASSLNLRGKHALAMPALQDDTRTEVGVEYVGATARPPLGLSRRVATDFMRILAQNLALNPPVLFWDWAEEMAWERDFRDPTKGWWGSLTGLDDRWVDDVDFVYYIGHGAPKGISFSSRKDAEWFTHDNAVWGNRDLEWIALNACETLGGGSTGTYRADAVDRWKPAFAGLHMMLGFATISVETTEAGSDFANRLANFSSPQNIRYAWMAHTIHEQPSPFRRQVWWGEESIDIYAAILFPYNRTGVSGLGDYLHKLLGPIGPDIQPADINGWMRIIWKT